MTLPSALSLTTRITAPALACLTIAALATPASAARPDSSSTVRSGANAFVSWTEQDPADELGLPGNTHVGYLSVEDGVWGSYAYGGIADYDCEPGQVPGGHGDPGSCTFVQHRNLSAEGITLAVSGSTATFTGTLTVSNGGHGEPGSVVVAVPASVTWTATAGLVRFRATHSYVEGKTSYRSRISGTRSDKSSTVVTGALGRMGFADDADDVTVGEFRSYTEVWRERTR